MKVNPINVINLLLTTFQSLQIPDSPINNREIALKEQIESILLDSMNEFNNIGMIVDDTLDFQEPYKDMEVQIVEDQIQHTIPDPPYSPTNECTKDTEDLS